MATSPADVKFQRVLHLVLNWEGGYVNRKEDPGGATNFGITQRAYDGYRHSRNLPLVQVKQIAQSEVEDIYRAFYWAPTHADEFPYPLALLLFDSAVEWGVHDAFIKIVDASLGLPLIPAKALEFLKKKNLRQAVIDICNARIAARYKRIAQAPKSVIFLKGWLNREGKIKAEALEACAKLSRNTAGSAEAH